MVASARRRHRWYGRRRGGLPGQASQNWPSPVSRETAWAARGTGSSSSPRPWAF